MLRIDIKLMKLIDKLSCYMDNPWWLQTFQEAYFLPLHTEYKVTRLITNP